MRAAFLRLSGVLLLAGAFAPGWALAGGSTAANFLQMDTSARSMGMGSAFVAVADDHSALYHNPAGLAQVDRKEAGLDYVRAPMDVAYHDATYAHPLPPRWTAAAGFNYMNVGPLTKTDDTGAQIGTYMGTGMAIELALARDLGYGLKFGVGGKIVRESLDTRIGAAPAFDVGLLYDYSRLRIGAAVKEMGPGLKLSQDTIPLPMTVKYGASYRVTTDGFVDALIVSAEARHVRDEDMQGAFGSELRLRGAGVCDFLALRIGYKVRDEYSSEGPDITGSFGVRILDNYYVDLAFLPYEKMGIMAVVSLTVRFGSARE
ncbi:MAG: PorV/PorQ family protein [Elusimicrobia bacterium]|nr:PorV/PorQ family protein [Elusimicrobiota bacterium]